MICKECEYCEYIHYDGYNCKKFNAWIPDDIYDKDIDCMIYDWDYSHNIVVVDDDGVKVIHTQYINHKSL